jgi:hypothetical protein
MGEGVSEYKLLFGVLRVRKWRELKSSTLMIPKCQREEYQNECNI